MEDNPADVMLVHKALEAHGVAGELIAFADGEKAIQFISGMGTSPSAPPDLVIIDLNLPRMSGCEVLEAMGRSERFRDIPAVVLSSSNAPEDREAAARLGAKRYIQKPTRLNEFLSLGAIFKEILNAA